MEFGLRASRRWTSYDKQFLTLQSKRGNLRKILVHGARAAVPIGSVARAGKNT